VGVASVDTRPASFRHRRATPADTRPPPVRPGMVPRSRLVRRLRACREVPLALVVAPAGYGKSTLLAEWAARDERPFAWLSLAHDAERAVTTAEQLLEDAIARGVAQVVVVDDAHRGPRAAARRLADAVLRLPPGAMLVLAARHEPALPSGRLRAHRLLVDVTDRELAMTPLEAARLLAAAGAQVDASDIDVLMERTGGWPAALYLAALSLAEQPAGHDAVANFTGGDRLVADYLRDELLAGLTERRRVFLRRTSILPRLTGPLCDAVVDAPRSAELLVSLRAGGLPVEPLDHRQLAFRYHPLLASMLQTELLRLEPELVPLLHRRAADWHSRHGDPDEAIPHAVACRDATRAGRLLWARAPLYITDGRAPELGRWLEPFAEREVTTRPELALSAAVYHLAEGRRDLGEHFTAIAERALRGAGDGHRAAVAMLRACTARRGIRRMGADAGRACALAAPESAWQGLGLYLTGVARHLTGEREVGRARLEEGAERAAGHVPLVAALCRAQLALLAAESGAWDDAVQHADEAQATVGGATPPVARAVVLTAGTVVAAHAGEVARARHDAGDARALLAATIGFPAWLVAEALVWLARTEIALSDGPTARRLLARAARMQPQVPDATVLSEWIHDGWARADALAESATGDGPMLTNAELRVLRLLPSHLSFREIGERLHVSANTVKTQALAVYRKLDVSCRSDAVDRGRAAGLIAG
jgi:LuxR family maltose regulon positive regulatory protein